jgi:hypothetical protein
MQYDGCIILQAKQRKAVILHTLFSNPEDPKGSFIHA